MVASTLRKIAQQLRVEAEEPEIDREAVYTAIRRIIAQAEMLEEGLDMPEQVTV